MNKYIYNSSIACFPILDKKTEKCRIKLPHFFLCIIHWYTPASTKKAK